MPVVRSEPHKDRPLCPKLEDLRPMRLCVQRIKTERAQLDLPGMWHAPRPGDFNAACNIKEFGLKALPTERGKVKPVDCPMVDDRPRVLKSRGRKKQEKEEVLVSPKPLNL